MQPFEFKERNNVTSRTYPTGLSRSVIPHHASSWSLLDGLDCFLGWSLANRPSLALYLWFLRLYVRSGSPITDPRSLSRSYAYISIKWLLGHSIGCPFTLESISSEEGRE